MTTAPALDPITTWRLDLSWHGGAFVGWQRQAQGRSIQAVVEAALGEVLGGEEVRLDVAGRTDAGVHALHQVAAFETRVVRTPDAMRRGLNARLPRDVVCLSATVQGRDFDPRGWTLRKHYRYRLLERETRCPLREPLLWHWGRPLAVDQMAAAAALLVGRHDWTSFRATGCGAHSPTRKLEALTVHRVDDEVWIEAQGNGFLRHQVRIIAGTLVEVGRGAQQPEWVVGLLAARDRSLAGPTAPAQGLWLVSVEIGEGPRPGAPVRPPQPGSRAAD
jgi:tRNA pseudouridine38-40 synthase